MCKHWKMRHGHRHRAARSRSWAVMTHRTTTIWNWPLSTTIDSSTITIWIHGETVLATRAFYQELRWRRRRLSRVNLELIDRQSFVARFPFVHRCVDVVARANVCRYVCLCACAIVAICFRPLLVQLPACGRSSSAADESLLLFLLVCFIFPRSLRVFN